MDNTDKFLPIGSIVLLNGGEKKVMVTGFCSAAIDDPKKVYDYTGCTYPEGYLDFEQICLFDHDQISKVYFVGYKDEEEKQFKKNLRKMLDNRQDEEIQEEDENRLLPTLDDDNNEEELEYL